MSPRKAFTLIELLIVVAIIAILAAIAVPNFLEAQIRSKVSRVKADMRSMATAVESFYVDHNFYPPDGIWPTPSIVSDQAVEFITERTPMPPNWQPGPRPAGSDDFNPWLSTHHMWLTTPVAHMTTLPGDPFHEESPQWYDGAYIWENMQDRFRMDPGFQTTPMGTDGEKRPAWILSSIGPDREKDDPYTHPGSALREIYDTTNGTTSYGDIFRWGP